MRVATAPPRAVPPVAKAVVDPKDRARVELSSTFIEVSLPAKLVFAVFFVLILTGLAGLGLGGQPEI